MRINLRSVSALCFTLLLHKCTSREIPCLNYQDNTWYPVLTPVTNQLFCLFLSLKVWNLKFFLHPYLY